MNAHAAAAAGSAVVRADDEEGRTLMQIGTPMSKISHKRVHSPSRDELHHHLRVLANKPIDHRTTLLVQTVVYREYMRTVGELQQTNEQSGSSSEETSDDEFGPLVRVVKRKKFKNKRAKRADERPMQLDCAAANC
ncbi:hypothetical protein M3Y99_01589400 [Aphelenchoides fujianensis]|nr:hypothetical protein M3Y99_01589400 [Aphelenchoides fujianensis]